MNRRSSAETTASTATQPIRNSVGNNNHSTAEAAAAAAIIIQDDEEAALPLQSSQEVNNSNKNEGNDNRRRRHTISSNDLWSLALANLSPPSSSTTSTTTTAQSPREAAATATTIESTPSANAGKEATEELEVKDQEEEDFAHQTVVVHSIPVPVPTFTERTSASNPYRRRRSIDNSDPALYNFHPRSMDHSDRSSASRRQRRSSPSASFTITGRSVPTPASGASTPRTGSGGALGRGSGTGSGPRRRATHDSMGAASSVTSDCVIRRNSIRFRHDDPDNPDHYSLDDASDNSSSGLGPHSVDHVHDVNDHDDDTHDPSIMDLRPSDMSAVHRMETSSLVSFSSNISMDSELASGLFQVATYGDTTIGGNNDNSNNNLTVGSLSDPGFLPVGYNLHQEQSQAGGGGLRRSSAADVGEAIKGDLPKHWEDASAGYTTSQQHHHNDDDKEQAYRALMSLMQTDVDNTGGDDSPDTTAGGTAGGNNNNTSLKRRGSHGSGGSAETGRSGFWSALGPHLPYYGGGNGDDDSSNSSSGNSKDSESSPLTRERKRRRRLYLRQCARAMAVFAILAALSGSIVFLIVEEDPSSNMLGDVLPEGGWLSRLITGGGRGGGDEGEGKSALQEGAVGAGGEYNNNNQEQADTMSEEKRKLPASQRPVHKYQMTFQERRHRRAAEKIASHTRVKHNAPILQHQQQRNTQEEPWYTTGQQERERLKRLHERQVGTIRATRRAQEIKNGQSQLDSAAEEARTMSEEWQMGDESLRHAAIEAQSRRDREEEEVRYSQHQEDFLLFEQEQERRLRQQEEAMMAEELERRRQQDTVAEIQERQRRVMTSNEHDTDVYAQDEAYEYAHEDGRMLAPGSRYNNEEEYQAMLMQQLHGGGGDVYQQQQQQGYFVQQDQQDGWINNPEEQQYSTN